MRLTKKIGFYDFFVFKCPSERYKKWQLHMNTLYGLVYLQAVDLEVWLPKLLERARVLCALIGRIIPLPLVW